MPSHWDHKADKDLLLAIIESANSKPIDWQAISTAMKAKAYTFTLEACRQHFVKIRKEARNGVPPTPTRATPNGKTASASRLTKTMDANAATYTDDDEEEFHTPSKRKRSAKKEKVEEKDFGGFAGQSALQFKVENGSNGPIVLDNDDENYD